MREDLPAEDQLGEGRKEEEDRTEKGGRIDILAILNGTKYINCNYLLAGSQPCEGVHLHFQWLKNNLDI